MNTGGSSQYEIPLYSFQSPTNLCDFQPNSNIQLIVALSVKY
jgi:hypothetical protein